MVKIELRKKTIKKMINLFKVEKKKQIKTVKGILNKMDLRMKECLIEENKSRRKRNYSSAEISENYFFALFFLREHILGKELNVHKERKRLLKRKFILPCSNETEEGK